MRDWKTPLDESYGLRQTSITDAPKELDLGATMVTDAQIYGSGAAPIYQRLSLAV